MPPRGVKVEKQEVLDDEVLNPYCDQYDQEVAEASSAMPVKIGGGFERLHGNE